MDLTEVQSEIKNFSAQTEQIFLSLADRFPALLNKKGGTALENLQSMFTGMEEKNKNSSSIGQDLFTNFDKKYTALFEQLN